MSDMQKNFHPVAGQIEALLVDNKYWYERFEHEPVRTSEEASRVRSEYALAQGTKSLIVRAKKIGQEKRFIMLVVPGDKQFDPKKLKAETGYTDIRFANPSEAAEITGGVLFGGVPPFGNLFDLPVFVDTHVFDNEKIIFNAGDMCVSIGMFSKDYQILVKPEVVAIA